MIPKSYQIQALDQLELFFKRCKETNNPRQAYEDTTREGWIGTALSYRPLPTLTHVPYVCLRIPTGGGKTLIGGLSIERANRSLLYTRYSVTLWLVPSDTILAQTLKALKTPSNLLHQAVFSALGEVTVLDIEEALRVRPAVLHGSSVVIVATMQSFKQENMDRLTVYKQNTDMMPHFENMPAFKVQGNTSFVDMLRLHHPYIIVDEAHNQGSDLAFETLARFEPSAILELTATPDRIHHPSNVLFSVSAAALQDADMIKMPLELVRRENPQELLRDAVACLNTLDSFARAETGEYIRPVMLLQAERHDQERETITPEKVKAMLLEDFSVPESEIAISTGMQDEIDDRDILSPQCPLRFIITIDKLREGWDCPFAYVLCSFRNTNSATAAEQILGRILRLPYTRRKTARELNVAYAFVMSQNFQETVESLRDGLVRNGFERQETKDLIRSAESADLGELFTGGTVTYATPEMPDISALPLAILNKIELSPETGSITLKGALSQEQSKKVEAVFKTEAGKEALRKAVQKQRAPIQPTVRFPSDAGELFSIPVLAIKQGELWEPFEETHLLQGAWHLLDHSAELSEDEFRRPEKTAQGGRFDVTKDEQITFRYFENIEAVLAGLDYQMEWTQVELVGWLDRNIYDESILPDEKASFLNKAVTYLIASRGLSLQDLCYAKFRLRNSLERKIKSAKQSAMKMIYKELLLNLDNFSTTNELPVVFENGRYAYDYAYAGFTALPKHFFPVIGNLKDTGEEFTCALFLATGLEGVKYWVRNIERKPGSFSLQTGTDRFYPDFICQMEDGRILAVEYKNERDWDLPDNKEKREVGELWARRSNGKCVFIMPKGQRWEQIREALSR